MSWVAVAVGVGTVAVGAYSADQQRKAADKASDAQIASGDRSIDEQRRQFDTIQKLLSPYVQAGETSLTQQQALVGLGGPDAQQAAIKSLEESPQFKALTKQGEDAILSNASATGGLRGGNVQRALSQYRPQVLSGLIDQQYNRLGGLTQIGQASATGQASAAQNTANSISNLLQQQGAAQAGNYLAQGQIGVNQANQTLQGLSTIAGAF